jgi:uncharacterized damage-inducible protein DinB
MTASELHDLFQYNSWAHRRIFDIISPLPRELYMKNNGTSHGNLHGTVTHTVGAEEIWLKRWTGAAVKGMPKPDDFPDFTSLRQHWETIDKKIHEFCDSLTTEHAIRKDVVYHDLKGNQYSQPLFQLMQHLVNHSSYHRGQIVAQLRQYAVAPVSTDMVVFFREKAVSHNQV